MAKVLIRHPRTGAEYQIEAGDFRRRKLHQDADGSMQTYEAAGFRVVSYADGSPYQQPAPKAEG